MGHQNLGIILEHKCLFHLLVQKYFDLQYFLNVFKYFWPCSNMQIHKGQKRIDCVQKILNMVKQFWTQLKYFWASRWNRQKCFWKNLVWNKIKKTLETFFKTNTYIFLNYFCTCDLLPVDSCLQISATEVTLIQGISLSLWLWVQIQQSWKIYWWIQRKWGCRNMPTLWRGKNIHKLWSEIYQTR